jgi:hypothetical protein
MHIPGLSAVENNICIVDAGHYSSRSIVPVPRVGLCQHTDPKAVPQTVDANCQPRTLSGLEAEAHGFTPAAVLVNENADRPFQLLSALTKALLNVALDPE